MQSGANRTSQANGGSDSLRYLGCRALAATFMMIFMTSGAANSQPNPYGVVDGWAKPPAGRVWGSMSWVYPAADGGMWVAERCGGNSCASEDSLAPVLLFDRSGVLVRSFGAGMFAWPHGIYCDSDGNVWVADGRSEGGKGLQVIKFSPNGEVLMRLGTAGVAGSGPNHFSGPTDVVVAPDGSIFVTDGHEPESNNRVVKFSPDGQFVAEWGGSGSTPGQFRVPHAITIDSGGRLFVGDRDNNRIQIFDQQGNFLSEWRQFGRPSGLFVDRDDRLYVSDNQSNTARNPGWTRGVRIGSAHDGSVEAFVPDPAFDPENELETGAHGVAADADGSIFGAEVGAQTVKKYPRR